MCECKKCGIQWIQGPAYCPLCTALAEIESLKAQLEKAHRPPITGSEAPEIPREE